VAAVVSLGIGIAKEGFPQGMIEGASILLSLGIIIVVNSGNNWISEKRLSNLVKLSDKQEVAVYRNSDKPITIDSDDLVVGDIVKVEAGMKIPADMLLTEGQEITVNQVALNGESDFVEKVRITS